MADVWWTVRFWVLAVVSFSTVTSEDVQRTTGRDGYSGFDDHFITLLQFLIVFVPVAVILISTVESIATARSNDDHFGTNPLFSGRRKRNVDGTAFGIPDPYSDHIISILQSVDGSLQFYNSRQC
ncbi:Uncharacterised protein g10393 [Pycnogonum litorale]